MWFFQSKQPYSDGYFPTWIPGCDSHIPALLDLFIDANIFSTVAFPPLKNSDHTVVSVSIDFSSNSKAEAFFHYTAYDYTGAGWDGLRDHLKDVSWEDIFKLGASVAVVSHSCWNWCIYSSSQISHEA